MSCSISLNPTDASVAQLVAVARRGEAAGLRAVYCYDHLTGTALGGGSSVHVWAALGAIAQATSQIEVGSLVVNTSLRAAHDIALATTTLQDLSEGRFILGLGAGAPAGTVWADEMRMLGIPPASDPRRRAHVVEVIAFLRALWRGDRAFAGESCRFDQPDGFRAVAAPVLVGANGPRMVTAALDAGVQGINLHHWQPDLAELVEAIRRSPGADAITISVEAPLDPEWADAGSPGRRRLASLGVDEVVLAWSAGIDPSAIDSISWEDPQ